MNKAPALNFCFSSLGCPEKDIDSILDFARQWGFGGVELRAANGHIDIVRALSECYGTPAKMADAIRDCGVRIASLDSSLQLLSAEARDKDDVLELAHWADALDVAYIRVFDGKSDNPKPGDAEIKGMLATLGWWHKMKQQHRFRCDLMIETHWVLTDPAMTLALAAAAPHPVHLLWDCFHTWKASDLSVHAVWEQLKPYVRHVHFKDGKINQEPAGTVKYCLPADGDFPLSELFELLSKERFRGWVSFEWESLWHPDIPPLDAALTRGRKLGWW